MNDQKRRTLIAQQRAVFEARTGGWVQFPIDGYCASCGCDIISRISPEKLRAEPVTGCPSCKKSFVS